MKVKIKNSLIGLTITVIVLPFFIAGEICLAKERPQKVDAYCVWSKDSYLPGELALLAIVINIDKEVHINADARQIPRSYDGFLPYPTSVEIIDDLKNISIQSTVFKKADTIDKEFGPVFKNKTVAYIPIKIEKDCQAQKVLIRLFLKYQACGKNICFPPDKIEVTTNLIVSDLQAESNNINSDIFADYKNLEKVAFDLFGWTFSIDVSNSAGLIFMLIIAVLGGFLLNFTPCVLPLLPIKIMGLQNAGQNSRKRCFVLGLSSFFGVIFLWLVLGIMVAVISGFTAANQLFHYPLFTLSIGIIIAFMGAGMLGLFQLSFYGLKTDYDQKTIAGSFALGILTAVLSTPCTAPFMGTAAAWAATKTPFTALAIFLSIGFGMAWPYLVLSIFPKLLNKIPSIGEGSILIKQVMGLFILGASAFFIGSGLTSLFSSPISNKAEFYWPIVCLFCASAGFWMIYRAFKIDIKKSVRRFFITAGIIIIILSFFAGKKLLEKDPIIWEYYTPAVFEKALQENKTVVMVFTAKWCLNCKALEKGTLKDKELIKMLAQKDVAAIKVDLTGKNNIGKQKLKSTGSLTIPLIVVYSPDGKVLFKGDFYTAEQIKRAILSKDNSN